MRTNISPRCAFALGLLIALVVASTASGQGVNWTKNPAEGVGANAGKIVAEAKITCAITLDYTATIFAMSSTTKRIHATLVPPGNFAAPVPVPGQPNQQTVAFTAVAAFDQTGAKLPNDTYDVWIIASINSVAYAPTLQNATIQNGAGAHNPQGSVTLNANGGKMKVTGGGNITITNPRNGMNPNGWIAPNVTFYAIPTAGGPVRQVAVVTAINMMTGIGTWPVATINCPATTYNVIGSATLKALEACLHHINGSAQPGPQRQLHLHSPTYSDKHRVKSGLLPVRLEIAQTQLVFPIATIPGGADYEVR